LIRFWKIVFIVITLSIRLSKFCNDLPIGLYKRNKEAMINELFGLKKQQRQVLDIDKDSPSEYSLSM